MTSDEPVFLRVRRLCGWQEMDTLLCLCVQLVEGEAEIFGFPLELGEPVNITGRQLAVFTWQGAQLVLSGKTDMA